MIQHKAISYIKGNNETDEESDQLEIKDFFEQYANAFSKRDLAGVVNAYSFPIVFYLEDGTSHLMNEPEFYENSKKLIAIYEGIGMEMVNFRVVSIKQINPSSSLVEIEWSLLDPNGNQLVNFITVYIVGNQNSKLKIIGVFLVNEREKIFALTQTY